MLGFLRRMRGITKIAMRPPAPLPDRAGIALVLIVRNEERHIAEWAEFHRAAGVRHFFVYDDGCTDRTIENLARSVPHDQRTILPWHQKLRDAASGAEIHNQLLAYAHATSNFGAQFRWMSYIDADEFLVPKRASDLPEALAHLEGCRNISLPWHMFGRSGHQTPPGGAIIDNYTLRNPDPMSAARGLCNFKAIVDPCHVTAMRVHSIETDGMDRTCNDRGEVFTAGGRERPDFYSADHIQLNHYYTRSDSELREKIARGPNLTTPDADHLRRVMRKVENIERAEILDRSAPDFMARRRAQN